MQDLNIIPMVDVISELTKRTVVMKDTNYVFFDTKENVEDEVIAEATILKAQKEEELRVSSINDYTKSIITTKYPLEKQSSANLGIYGDEYKNEMISFISNCITLSNEAIENGTSFEDYKAMLDVDNKGNI